MIPMCYLSSILTVQFHCSSIIWNLEEIMAAQSVSKQCISIPLSLCSGFLISTKNFVLSCCVTQGAQLGVQ